MKEKLLKVLLAIGISKENAELISNFESDATKLDEAKLIEDFKANQLALHENEPAIVNKIEIATLSRERDKFERKIRQGFGLNAEELQGKKLEEIIEIAKIKANSNQDKNLEQLQNELLEKTNRIKTLEETEIPGIRSEVDKHKKQFNINDKLTKRVSNNSLRVPLDAAMARINQIIAEKYDIDLDDKGDIVPYVKGSKMIAKNTDGTKFLNIDEIIIAQLTEDQFLKQSNAEEGSNGPTAGKTVATVDNGKVDKSKFPGYDAAMKNLQDIKIK